MPLIFVEMHMKREQRAQGWEAGMGHGASWAVGTDLWCSQSDRFLFFVWRCT